MNILGFIFATLASLFFALYAVPKKISKKEPIYYMIFMASGLLLTSIIIYIINKNIIGNNIETLFHPILIIAFISGILSMIGTILFLISIDKLGLSRANIWKDLKGPIAALIVLIFMKEILTTNLILITLAIILIFTSAIIFTIKNKNEKIVSKTGIIYAITSSLLLGITKVLQKIVTDNGQIYSQQIYIALSMLLISIIFILIKKKTLKELNKILKKDNLLALTSGIIFYFALYFSALSYKYIPASIAFTIIQLSSIWTVFIGIFIFKEINLKKHWKRLLIGFIFAILGIITLSFTQK